MTSLLDDILGRLQALPPEERKEVETAAIEATKDLLWIPNPGPQTDAYNSMADILLYGGQGGGGKSDLGLGLAFSQHKRSLVMRREYANLGALTERAIEINGTRDGYNGSPPPLLRSVNGRYIQFAGNQHLGDEQKWQGQAFDFKYFDEATQFLELQIRFHIGWLRSVEPGQRCRAVLGTNPPINADGDWIIGMFRPWLDVTYHKPAKHGELRWFVTAPDGTDLEVDDEKPIQLPGAKKPSIPMSRSFIPAALADNPFLVNTGYESKLDGLPEPIRSAVRDGNFMAARADAAWQVIPTQWIIEAQARWKPDGWKDFAMTAMGFDPAGGGKDAAELVARHGYWFSEIVTARGAETADGSAAAGTIIRHRRDNAPVIVDCGGGWGGQVTLRLKDNAIPFIPFVGSTATGQKTKDRQLGFANRRAESYWRLREALDPDQEGGSPIALPPDPELRSDLASPTYQVTARGILLEPKEDLKERIGRSPGKGDAVAMAWSEGQTAVRRNIGGMGARHDRPTHSNVGYSNLKRNRRSSK